jgi:hypothetical protein
MLYLLLGLRTPVTGWTSTNTLALTSVIAYHINHNWALHEILRAFNEVDSPFFGSFDITLQFTGQGSTPWSTASRTFAGSYSSFCTVWWPFTCNYNR